MDKNFTLNGLKRKKPVGFGGTTPEKKVIEKTETTHKSIPLRPESKSIAIEEHITNLFNNAFTDNPERRAEILNQISAEVINPKTLQGIAQIIILENRVHQLLINLEKKNKEEFTDIKNRVHQHTKTRDDYLQRFIEINKNDLIFSEAKIIELMGWLDKIEDGVMDDGYNNLMLLLQFVSFSIHSLYNLNSKTNFECIILNHLNIDEANSPVKKLLDFNKKYNTDSSFAEKICTASLAGILVYKMCHDELHRFHNISNDKVKIIYNPDVKEYIDTFLETNNNTFFPERNIYNISRVIKQLKEKVVSYRLKSTIEKVINDPLEHFLYGIKLLQEFANKATNYYLENEISNVVETFNKTGIKKIEANEKAFSRTPQELNQELIFNTHVKKWTQYQQSIADNGPTENNNWIAAILNNDVEKLKNPTNIASVESDLYKIQENTKIENLNPVTLELLNLLETILKIPFTSMFYLCNINYFNYEDREIIKTQILNCLSVLLSFLIKNNSSQQEQQNNQHTWKNISITPYALEMLNQLPEAPKKKAFRVLDLIDKENGIGKYYQKVLTREVLSFDMKLINTNIERMKVNLGDIEVDIGYQFRLFLRQQNGTTELIFAGDPHKFY